MDVFFMSLTGFAEMHVYIDQTRSNNQTSSIKDFLSIRWEVFSDLYNFLSFDTKVTDLIQAGLGIHYATIFNDNHCILLYS